MMFRELKAACARNGVRPDDVIAYAAIEFEDWPRVLFSRDPETAWVSVVTPSLAETVGTRPRGRPARWNPNRHVWKSVCADLTERGLRETDLVSRVHFWNGDDYVEVVRDPRFAAALWVRGRTFVPAGTEKRVGCVTGRRWPLAAGERP